MQIEIFSVVPTPEEAAEYMLIGNDAAQLRDQSIP